MPDTLSSRTERLTVGLLAVESSAKAFQLDWMMAMSQGLSHASPQAKRRFHRYFGIGPL